MTLVIRPIRYTSKVAAMREWAVSLGMAPLLDTEGWAVLGAGRGRLALHHVPEGDPQAGTTTFAVETDDLDALQQRWSAAGLVTRRTDEHGVPLLFVTTPFGGEIAAGDLSTSTAQGQSGGDLAVMPMLVTHDVPGAADWLATHLGLQRRISSEGGGWTDLEIAEQGGLVAIHHAGNLEFEPPAQAPAAPGSPMHEVAVGLSFEHSDVDALLERVRAAGLDDAHVIDEAYNRTLLVDCPDGDTIWVNGKMADLYGYRRD